MSIPIPYLYSRQGSGAVTRCRCPRAPIDTYICWAGDMCWAGGMDLIHGCAHRYIRRQGHSINPYGCWLPQWLAHRAASFVKGRRFPVVYEHLAAPEHLATPEKYLGITDDRLASNRRLSLIAQPLRANSYWGLASSIGLLGEWPAASACLKCDRAIRPVQPESAVLPDYASRKRRYPCQPMRALRVAHNQRGRGTGTIGAGAAGGGGGAVPARKARATGSLRVP